LPILKAMLFLSAVFCLALFIGCGTSNPPPSGRPTATPSNPPANPSNVPADNTAKNQRDREPGAKTPIDQDEDQADVNSTAEIRKEILAQGNMSGNARNAKGMTAKGKVTLRGPVDSDAERDTIQGIAEKVAGKENVDNQLEVTTK